MIVIPIYQGRLLKEIKRYPNFILFEDPKTKAKISYTYYELGYKKTPQIEQKNVHLKGE